MERICENCARDDDDMATVRRVYVTPETWDTPESTRAGAGTELWCFSCRSQYPHELVEDE